MTQPNKTIEKTDIKTIRNVNIYKCVECGDTLHLLSNELYLGRAEFACPYCGCVHWIKMKEEK